MRIQLLILTLAVTMPLLAESWSSYNPGSGPKGVQVEFGMAGDALQMKFLPGNIENGQAWGSKRIPFPGFNKKVKMSLQARAENTSDPGAWVQFGFQGRDAADKDIKANELKRVPAAKLTDWTLLEYEFAIPGPDSKWGQAKDLIVSFSGRTSGEGVFLFKDIQYRVLPDNAVVLKDYNPGKGPAGVKSEVSVVDDTVIQVKYLPGNIAGGHNWFSREVPKPAPGATVKITVDAKASGVVDPKSCVQLSIQGKDKDGKNIKAYILKKISAFDLEEWETLSHSFKIPASDAKWDFAAVVVCGFSAISADGIFQFKDFTITIE